MIDRSGVNWRQAAGEAVLIFAGVVVALAGQAWWETRQEQEMVREHTAALVDEVDANLAELGDFRPQLDSVRMEYAELVRIWGEPSGAERDERLQAELLATLNYRDLRPATAALDALLASGDLRSFDDPRVRLAISRYARALQDYRVVDEERAQLLQDKLLPALIERVPLVHVPYIADRFFDGDRVPPAAAPDAAALGTSLELQNIIVGQLTSTAAVSRFTQALIDEAEALRAALSGEAPS